MQYLQASLFFPRIVDDLLPAHLEYSVHDALQGVQTPWDLLNAGRSVLKSAIEDTRHVHVEEPLVDIFVLGSSLHDGRVGVHLKVDAFHVLGDWLHRPDDT